MQFVPGKMMKKQGNQNKRPRPKGFCQFLKYTEEDQDGSQICRQCCYRRQFPISRRYTLDAYNGIVQGAGNNQRIG